MAAESKLELRCRKLAESHGYELKKWVSPGTNGMPDRILLGPKRFIAFLEFKAPDGVVSAPQDRWIKRLREFEFRAEVIWNFEDFAKLLPFK